MAKLLDDPPRAVTFKAQTSSSRVIDVAYPPGTDFDTHVHEEAYLCLVVRGAYEEWRPERRSVAPATRQVWRAGSSHAVRTGPEPVRILHVADSSDAEWMAEGRRSEGLLWQLAAAVRGHGGGPSATDDAHELHVEALVAELTAARDAASDEPAADDGRWLGWVRERLRDGYREPVSFRELAASAGRHPAHLARAFKARWGMTPGEFLRRVRVAEAVGRLRSSDAPLSMIALESGFHDQSHMGRWVRRYVGASPGALRRGRWPVE